MTSCASRRLAAVCVAVLMGAVPAAASAQSLADVARAEQARRKEYAQPAKVYTNDSLRTDPAPRPAGVDGAAPAAAPADVPVPAPAAPAAPAAGEPRDEAYWKGRVSAAREQLERSLTFAEALQARINALSADFVSRDDPAQQRLVSQNRTKAVADLDRVQREIASHTEAITAIEDEARKAGVPPGWLR